MNRKAVSGIMLILILISTLTLAFSIQPVKGQLKTWTVDDDGPADFFSIQEAINSPLVMDGDTIYIHNGTYYENVVVDKTVALLGENKSATVIVGVKHSPVWESVVSVWADDVKIANLTTMNGGHGIYLGARRSIVTNCRAYENNFGLTISSSSKNYLRRNLLFNNSYNLLVLGFWAISDFIHDIDSSNHVNGKPVYYLINEQNLSINPATFPNIGYLGIVNSKNVQITDLSLSNNGDGLLIAFSSNLLIDNVEATHNYRGISLVCSSGIAVKNCNSSYNNLGMLLYYSDNVKIKENSILHNDGGIFLLWSNHNLIHHNNFIENYRYYQTRVENSYYCDWDDGYPSGGNYWSDQYHGECADHFSGPGQDIPGSDGIVDTPYVIDENNQDRYPLMTPWIPPRIPPGVFADLLQRKAWPEHHHYDISKDEDEDQTLYARVKNRGNRTVWVKALFNITKEDGSSAIIESEPMLIETEATVDLSANFGPLADEDMGKYSVSATCSYSHNKIVWAQGKKTKAFKFNIVP